MESPISQLPTSSSHADDVLVRVEGVGKRFCRDLKRSLFYGVQDVASEFLGKDRSASGLRPKEFWANEGISFELRRGECLGLIGKNGAGKTTLLKMLNGLIKPDAGKIEMRGRVGALIALGAGFNPILTGRENVFIAGSVLGLTKKEIETKYDSIVDFAELHDFMESPVQSYSSGMQVRLGFAVASALNPDVLLVDEVLAVGDSAFKVRCYNRIRELLPMAAVILVSHSMFDITRACNKVMVLKKGECCFLGDLQEGVHVYNLLNEDGQERHDLVIHKDDRVSAVEDIDLETRCNGVHTEIDFQCQLKTTHPLGQVRTRFVFFDETGSVVAEWDSELHETHRDIQVGTHQMSYRLGNIRLKSGIYRLAVVFTDPKNSGYYVGIEYGLTIQIKNSITAGAPYRI